MNRLALTTRGLDLRVILRVGIAHCEKVSDYVTRELLEDILKGEEEHVDWIEKQNAMISRMGLENYVQLQSDASSGS